MSSATTTAQRTEVAADSPLAEIFARVAADTGVPADELAAVSWNETRFHFASPAPGSHAFQTGLLALTESGPRDLHRGAALAGVRGRRWRRDDGERCGRAGECSAGGVARAGCTRGVAAANGAAAALGVTGGALVALDAPELVGMPVAIVAANLDGDCDDDVIVATDAAPPQVWKREGATFVVGEAVGTMPAAAARRSSRRRRALIGAVRGRERSHLGQSLSHLDPYNSARILQAFPTTCGQCTLAPRPCITSDDAC